MRVRPAEYHDPQDSSGEASMQRHAERYDHAIDYFEEAGAGLWESYIIDAACGSGYGTDALAFAFPGVDAVGAERNPKAIHRARDRYPLASFYCLDLADARTWLKWFKPLQAVVCIETLEHLDGPGAQRKWIAAVSSTLEEGGLLWIACPIRDEPGPSLVNPFHLWEPSLKGVRAMLEWAGLDVVHSEIETYYSTAGEDACQLEIMARKP